MQDRTEEFLRMGLKRFERPQPSSTLVADIMRLAQNSERARSNRWLARRGHLLKIYWVAAALGSTWILWRLPLPQWTPSPLPERWAWLVPVLCGALLCSAPLIKSLSALWARLLFTSVHHGGQS